MIKYRKAKELIDQVADDLGSYDDAGLVDYSRLYKVIRKCNATLGLRINPEKTEIVRIEKYRGILPDDFRALNYALICTTKTVNVTPPKGFQIEYKTVCTRDNKCKPCLTECDNDYVIYQYLDDDWTQYKNLEVLRVNNKSLSRCSAQCPNMFSASDKMFEIGDNGQITTNFETGTLYINYTGDLEDDEEDLLIIDDPIVEPYYENELIRQITRFLHYNKESDVERIYMDAKVEASRARTAAISYVNSIEYTEIRDLYQSQRERFYKKYFLPILGTEWNLGR